MSTGHCLPRWSCRVHSPIVQKGKFCRQQSIENTSVLQSRGEPSKSHGSCSGCCFLVPAAWKKKIHLQIHQFLRNVGVGCGLRVSEHPRLGRTSAGIPALLRTLKRVDCMGKKEGDACLGSWGLSCWSLEVLQGQAKNALMGKCSTDGGPGTSLHWARTPAII